MSAENIEDIYPITPLQQGLLFHDLLAPQAGLYISQQIHTIRNLNVVAFRTAWRRLVDLHPVLRTAFVWEDVEEPLQIVMRQVSLPWEELDWSDANPSERDALQERFLDQDRHRGFDLSAAPLLRLSLVRLDDAHYRFIWTTHHLILDGWSMPLLVQQLSAFYNEAAAVEPGRPYRDYIAWLGEQSLADAESYWRERLRGASPTLIFTTAGASSSYGEVHHRFSLAETDALRRLARNQQVTLSTLVQGAWALLLSRYGAGRDVMFGLTVSGRPAALAGVDQMVGMFVNTLPMRVRLNKGEKLAPWLRSIQEQQAELRHYEYSPLSQVQAWAGSAGQTLFDSVVIFENYPVSEIETTGDLQANESRSIVRSHYPITVVLGGQAALEVEIVYEHERVGAERGVQLLNHLCLLLQGMNPDATVSQIDMLSAAEKRELLVGWNNTQAPEARFKCVNRLFEEQVLRTPENIAVTDNSTQLTYRELNARANQVAHFLRRSGISAESRVGLLAGRSEWTIVALLGILKAGAGYVPLDPQYPCERLTFMLEDSQAALLLTDELWTEISREPAENLDVEIRPNDLAYVIYTSGSTGQPKGVMVEHQQFANTMLAAARAFGFTPRDVFPCLASFSFDISLLELFSPLLAGGECLLLTPHELFDAGAISSLSRATVLHAVPSLMRRLLAAGVSAKLRLALVGGEAVAPEVVRALHERFSEARVAVLYGPTEAAMICASAETEAGAQLIGRPLANTRLYLMDDEQQLVPAGIVGELHIAGASLARGYQDRPELTAEKFIPDPFAVEGGERLYRTGDLARYLSDGNIEFVGRCDAQVKVRGFRIELGEVESVLGKHDGVKEAIVTVRDELLVAYVVPKEAADVSDLRNYLQQKLPSYMVPAALVMLEKLPLSANGKVDRNALPAPGAEPRAEFVEPATPVELRLAEIWGELLRVDGVGANDNFFELGGHSLLAMQLVPRVNESFDVTMPLRAVFETQTLAQLAAFIEQQKGLYGNVPGTRPITPRVEWSPAPLSFAQQRLWFLDQLEPGSAFYNVPAAVRLEGELDVEALRQTIAELVRRHEILRTTFPAIDGRPVQVISPAAPVPLPVIDLTDLAEDQRETQALVLAAHEAEQPFDLSAGPLLRVTLLRLNTQLHIVLLAMHHIVCDGWSTGVLVREVASLYGAYVDGREPQLGELPIQYADYAVWQREWLQGEVLDQQIQYWRSHLGGKVVALDLPTDRPRPPVQTYRGATQLVTISAALTEQLKSLSQRTGATLFITLMAIFKTLLHCYCRQQQIIVGTPTAGRSRPETEALIGFFVNTLVLRTDLSGNPRFDELLQRVREVTLGAFEHQDVPFEKLVEELDPERDTSRTPMFQAMFILQNAPYEELQLPRLRLSGVNLTGSTAKHDLLLVANEQEDGVRLTLEFNKDLFDDSTAMRLLRHFTTLTEAVCIEPSRRLSELSLWSSAELREVLFDWNNTRVPYPVDQCVQRRFEHYAEQTPDAVALVYGEEELSYAELNTWANQLARHLQQLGTGVESRVGLCMERSVELIVSLLGVLKAGAAYVPLDPQYPKDRLAFMLDNSGVEVVLTHQAARDKLPEYDGPVVFVDDEWMTIMAQRPENLDVAVSHDNLCYVIYTSGSTGTPKGVMVNHSSVISLVQAILPQLEIADGETWTVFHSYSFDFSVWEIWGALLSGGKLVVTPWSATRSPEELRALLLAQRVTILSLTPSAMEQLIGTGLAELSLQKIVVGGEACPQGLAEKIASLGIPAWNFYGPTEATVWTAISPLAANEKVTIGRPIANTQLYILDEYLHPAPIGVAGELHIGGAGLARGYMQHAELTAQRFIPHPYSSEPGARLYKTGDLTRFLPDGRVEFIERIDNQVKVRGFRIELGDVETAIASHSSVKEVVVIVREDEPGDKRLVAYVVAVVGHGFSAQALREHARAQLPEYMVPAVVVELDQLPLTANGKVDRRSLPQPDASHFGEKDYQQPRTPVEDLLASIWAEVLRIEQVGIRDNFFDLGGHSLLATQVIARVRDAFQVELPLLALFKAPTVAGLAEQVEIAIKGGVKTRAIEPVGRDGHIPLSFAQQRLWFLDQLEPGSAFYNSPAAVRLTGRLDVGALERTLNEVLRRHEVLRTRFVTFEGEAVQVISPPQALSLMVVDLTEWEGREEEARRLAEVEARQPFDLSVGPLLRAKLLRLGEEEHVVLFTMHHIISDGWSTGILVREVAALYEAYIEGRESPLPELTIQYADYAVWQREWLQGEVLEQQLAYWRKQLGGELPVLQLPADRPRPAVQSYRGKRQFFSLTQELSEALKRVSRAEGVTLFMTLLAAFQVLLSRYSGQRDIVVGSDIANRTRLEIEGLIGFFINQIVLRTQLAGDPAVSELLGRVKKVTLEAYAHQDVPFEKLVEELQPERHMGQSPIFQVKLVLQNTAAETFELPGLKLSALPIESESARFDMTLSMAEQEGALGGALEYNTELFEQATVERLLGHFARLLEAVAVAPWQRLSELPLLTEAEERQLRVEWNETAAPYARGKCVHELVEERARLRPNAVAVSYEGQRLTYGELNGRANQLARYLRRLGVEVEARVGLCVERSLEMVVGMLGVLKAGGAYVPLDPRTPLERLSYMLADAGVSVLLTQAQLEESLPGQWVQVVLLDEEWEAISDESEANPEGDISPDNLAYVIYTSGSTGQPKGVLVTHRGVPNLAAAQAVAFGIGEESRVLQFATPAFDASVSEVWVTLAAGARLVLAEAEQLLPGGGLGELLREQEVTVVTLPPSVLRRVAGAEAEAQAGLSTVVAAGEACEARLAQQWSKGRRFCNAYGPTEVTVCATIWTADEASNAREAEGWAAIGKPLANTQVYVVDEQLRLAPVGVMGELCVGGVGLGRGYAGLPGLTAERFIPNPFSEEAGARLYRTGDVVRWLGSGELEFVGRRDRQVKVRGYRIELGEIEEVMKRAGQVQEAVVIAREEDGGERRLVAYVVRDSEAVLDVRELREQLRQVLPEYMVPGVIVELGEMPQTSSGKVDRRALAQLEVKGQGQREGSYQGARTLVEEGLCGLWQELLRVERIGIKDNFFELGGHSLLATQLVSRVREAFGVELGLRELFERPTVAGLAEKVEAGLRGGNSAAVPPLVAVSREERELPLSYAQQRLWFLDQLEPGSVAYNIPAAVRLRGQLDVGALERTLTEVVRRHEVLRTRIEVVNGAAVQVITSPAEVTLPVMDLSEMQVEEREGEARRIAEAEAQQPFDLSIGPLLRVKLLRLGEEEHVVLFTLHHIVSDGWSTGILVREVAALYEVYKEGRESPLAELTIQYADYAVWQREWLQGEVLEQQLAYWRRQLGGELPVLQLPTDKPRPAVPTYRGDTYSLMLSAELAAELKALSRTEGVTLFMTLLAALQTLLSRYSNQEEVLVGADIANRTRVETEAMIGFFVNLLVLRTRMQGHESFRELLRQVRETTLGAYAHQEVPFDKLVEELRPDRTASLTPFFNVLFVMQNTPRTQFELSGLTMDSFEGEHSIAKFELTLFASETEEGLITNWKYSSDLFSESAVSKIARQFETLLQHIVEEPEAQLDDLRIEVQSEDELYEQSNYLKLISLKPKAYQV